jgi:SAM-dependent methyltransferase
MWEANKTKIEQLAGDGLVLDIGGWCDPFPRADYVIDIFPYETRGLAYHGVGRLPTTCLYPKPLPGERFTKDTWIIHDICSEQPFPFPDKMFDFVVCSQVLEDVRDPLRACSEIIRVGRAGYIETPSRLAESMMDYDGLVGAAHHRWLIEIDDRITFRMKHHFLHTHPQYHIPPYYKRRMNPIKGITFLFWQDTFEYEEMTGYEFHQETRDFIASLHIPRSYYWLDALRRIKHKSSQWYRHFLQGIKKRGGVRANGSEELWTWSALFEANKLYLPPKRSPEK